MSQSSTEFHRNPLSGTAVPPPPTPTPGELGGVGRGAAASCPDSRGLLTSLAASRRAIRRGRQQSQGRGPSPPRMPLRSPHSSPGAAGERPPPASPCAATQAPPRLAGPGKEAPGDWPQVTCREVSGWRLAVGPVEASRPKEVAEAAPDSSLRPGGGLPTCASIF